MELRSHALIIEDVAPRSREIEAALDLVRLSERDLPLQPSIAAAMPHALGEVLHRATRGVDELLGQCRIVLPDLLDERPELADNLECNLIRDLCRKPDYAESRRASRRW